jgi:hypothetical protein
VQPPGPPKPAPREAPNAICGPVEPPKKPPLYRYAVDIGLEPARGLSPSDLELAQSAIGVVRWATESCPASIQDPPPAIGVVSITLAQSARSDSVKPTVTSKLPQTVNDCIAYNFTDLFKLAPDDHDVTLTFTVAVSAQLLR